MSINNDLQSSHRIIKLLANSLDTAERVMDTLPGIFILLNQNFQILRTNTFVQEFTNKDSEDLLLKNIDILFGDKSPSRFIQQHIQEKGASKPFEANLKKNDETFTFAFVSKEVQQDEPTNSDEHFYILIGEDVTSLRSFEQKLLRIFHNTPLGIFSILPNGKISPAFSQQLSKILDKQINTEHTLAELLLDNTTTSLTQEELFHINNLTDIFELDTDKQKRFINKLPNLFRYSIGEEDKWLKLGCKIIPEGSNTSELLFTVEDQSALIHSNEKYNEAKKKAEESQALYELALKDPLTSLYNRLHMNDAFANTIATFERGTFPHVSLAIFDLDHFKNINDTYGHRVGDDVLRLIGSIIRHEVRTNDIAVRYGGEEFVILMHVTAAQGKVLAERIRKSIFNQNFLVDGKKVDLSISGGVANLQKGDLVEDLIERADKLLYYSKENGRNQITLEE